MIKLTPSDIVPQNQQQISQIDKLKMQTLPIEAKVVVIGGIGVGKSSLTIRYVNNQFNEFLESTLGAVYFQKSQKHNNQTIKYQIWDTAGQEKYKAIAKIYYKDCKIAIVVYDVTKRQTFTQLKAWVEQLKNNGPTNVIIAVVGNKIDLLGAAGSHEEVSYQQALDYANSLGAIFKYTSAKDGKGIQELFEALADRLEKGNQTTSEISNPKGNNQKLKQNKKKKKSSCC